MNRYLVIPIRKKPALDGHPAEYIAEIETSIEEPSRYVMGFGRTPTEAIRSLFLLNHPQHERVERYVNESLGVEEVKP